MLFRISGLGTSRLGEKHRYIVAVQKAQKKGHMGHIKLLLTGTGWGRLLMWEQCAFIHHSGKVTGTL